MLIINLQVCLDEILQNKSKKIINLEHFCPLQFIKKNAFLFDLDMEGVETFSQTQEILGTFRKLNYKLELAKKLILILTHFRHITKLSTKIKTRKLNMSMLPSPYVPYVPYVPYRMCTTFLKLGLRLPPVEMCRDRRFQVTPKQKVVFKTLPARVDNSIFYILLCFHFSISGPPIG